MSIFEANVLVAESMVGTTPSRDVFLAGGLAPGMNVFATIQLSNISNLGPRASVIAGIESYERWGEDGELESVIADNWERNSCQYIENVHRVVFALVVKDAKGVAVASLSRV